MLTRSGGTFPRTGLRSGRGQAEHVGPGAARVTGLLGYEEPDAHCLPQGVPKINNAPVPFRIVQTEKLVVIVYEAFNLWRQVFLDVDCRPVTS